MEIPVNPQPPPSTIVSARRSKLFFFIPVLALAALLAAGGWLYRKYIYYPTTPQFALEKFFAAARDKDYDKIYDLVQVPPAAKVLVHNGQDLKAMAKRFPGMVPDLHDHKIGNVEVVGDKATLDSTTTIIGSDRKPTENSLKVKMVRTNGVWRVDGNWIVSEIAKKGLNGALINGTE